MASQQSIGTNAAQSVLTQLARENRRVLSEWRSLILLRRAIFSNSIRWPKDRELPTSPEHLKSILAGMVRRGEIDPIEQVAALYVVTAPYASTLPLTELEVLSESNPYATISHFTAMEFHQLTNQFPRMVYATIPRTMFESERVIGTTADDWDGLDYRPPARKPRRTQSRPIKWTTISRELFFGSYEPAPNGFPLRVTDLERTLVDAINAPKLCGGIYTVLQAWAAASDRLRIDMIVNHVERFNRTLLRQRVGFILEAMGKDHPLLEQWSTRSVRGSSAKLDGTQPFSSTYSERWSLSLNAPVEILEDR